MCMDASLYEFASATDKESIVAFLKKHDCDASIEEFAKCAG